MTYRKIDKKATEQKFDWAHLLAYNTNELDDIDLSRPYRVMRDIPIRMAALRRQQRIAIITTTSQPPCPAIELCNQHEEDSMNASLRNIDMDTQPEEEVYSKFKYGNDCYESPTTEDGGKVKKDDSFGRKVNDPFHHTQSTEVELVGKNGAL